MPERGANRAASRGTGASARRRPGQGSPAGRFRRRKPAQEGVARGSSRRAAASCEAAGAERRQQDGARRRPKQELEGGGARSTHAKNRRARQLPHDAGSTVVCLPETEKHYISSNKHDGGSAREEEGKGRGLT